MLMNNNPYTKYHIECDECQAEYLVYHINSEQSDLTPENCCLCASIIEPNVIDEPEENMPN
jgi:NAD-dependent SIR2 family protein deacetylase